MYLIDKDTDKTITASVGIVHPVGQSERFIIIKNKRGWDIPGGHIEAGESPREAFMREVTEETGCKVTTLHEVAKISSDTRPTTAMSVFVAVAELADFIATEEILARDIVDRESLEQQYFGDVELLKAILQCAARPKRVMVAGGAGFVGSNLCQRLVAEGNHVICVDDLSTGTMKNISAFLDNENFEFIEHSIVEPLDIIVDEIYNLASPASPPQYQKRPIETTMTNALGAYNLLMLAKRMNAKILQASTSEVYGDPIVSPQNESYNGNVNPIGVRSCYDEGKRVAESLFCDFNRMHHVDIAIVRIFNTYGINMLPDDGRVISNFITQRIKNESLTVYGDGNQTRSFMYIDDLIDALLKVMAANYNKPINLGNPHEVTIKDVADIILAKIPGTDSNTVHVDLPEDDPKQRKPDITTAKKILDWEPKVPLEEGLEKTIDYFKQLT